MAGERTLPGFGLTGFWDLGSAFKTGMDQNLLRLSTMVQGAVISRTTALPGSPNVGDIYLVPSDAGANPNEIAVYDGPVGSEAWVYLTPSPGWHVFVTDEAKNYQWTGATWAEFAGGGSGGGGTVAGPVLGQKKAVAARFWRLGAMHAHNSVTASAFSNIEFAATTGGPRMSGTASGSSHASSTPANDILNNDNSSLVWSAQHTPAEQRAWFQVDLGVGVSSELQEIRLKARSDGYQFTTPKEFDVLYSDDGETWFRLGRVVDPSGEPTAAEVRTFDVSEITQEFEFQDGAYAPVEIGLPINNGTFETGDFTGWVADGGTPEVEARVGGTGTWDSMLGAEWGTYVLSGGINSASGAYQDVDISTLPDATVFTCDMWIAQDDVSADTVTGSVQLLDSGGTVLDSVSKSANSPGEDKTALEITKVAGAVTLRLRLDFVKAATGGYINAAGEVVGLTALVPFEDPRAVQVSTQTPSTLTDAMLLGGKHVRTGATTITVPAGLSGTQPVVFEATDVGDVAFVAGAGATINSLNGHLKLAGQFATATLTPLGGDAYTLHGNLKA